MDNFRISYERKGKKSMIRSDASLIAYIYIPYYVHTLSFKLKNIRYSC